MAMTPEKWSVSALAVEFQMDRRTVARRLAEVLPAGDGPNGRVYWMRDAAPALVQAAAAAGQANGKLNLTDESARLKKMQADKAALEIAVMQAALIPAETVRGVWGGMLGACRQKLLSLPSTIAVRVEGLRRSAIQTEAERLIHHAMNELKQYDAADYVPAGHPSAGPGGHGADGAASKTDGEPVGGQVPPAVKRGKRGARAVADRKG
jgi:phage terminase Nu1 subunit (DNA packaging protein)